MSVKFYLFFFNFAASPSFVGEKTLPNDGRDTPESECILGEGTTGIGLRAEQGLLSTNTGAWPSNTADPALQTDDEMDGDWGRDSLAIRLLTSESGLADLGAWGTGEQRFRPDELVGLVLFLGLGLFPLGSGIILRGISGKKVALGFSVGEEVLEDILFTEELEELTSLDKVLETTVERFGSAVSLLLRSFSVRW